MAMHEIKVTKQTRHYGTLLDGVTQDNYLVIEKVNMLIVTPAKSMQE